MGECPSGSLAPAAYANNMAACSGPFVGSSCCSEGIVFSTGVTLLDVWQRNRSDLGAGLLKIQTPTAPAISELISER